VLVQARLEALLQTQAPAAQATAAAMRQPLQQSGAARRLQRLLLQVVALQWAWSATPLPPWRQQRRRHFRH
jgi:hypothetical protein